MIVRVIFALSLLLLIGCNGVMQKEQASSKELTTAIDTIPRVTGIGGIFFTSGNPAELSAWYGKQLGLVIDAYGSPFEFRNAHRPEEINYLRWSPFFDKDHAFAPSNKSFMINYRVNRIEALLNQLKQHNVMILDSIQEYPYGKFVHILDPDSNKVELWEPNDSFFTKQGGQTSK